jgi:phospholipase C
MRKCLSQVLVTGLFAGNLINPALVKAAGPTPATPIQHLVVIYQENISFDHYFATYPNATNPSGQPAFTALPNTPSVNGLSGSLLTLNPNSLNKANAAGQMNPFRLDRSQNLTSDQNHNYTPEQSAYHAGLADLFPSKVGVAGTATTGGVTTTGITMGYYDGNTVTAMWNYAQAFAMSDNSFSTNYGPSTPGAINLVSGQTNGAINNSNGTGAVVSDGNGGLTIISDADPVGDVCSTSTGEVYAMSSKNIGDLLNAAGVSWGFFAGGFDLSVTNPNGTAGCARSTTSALTNQNKVDYVPHHQPFQYYASTANPTHARPSSISAIGSSDAANHQYDLHDFYDAINAGNFPAVSFLKAIGVQDGHAGYSSPLDEQQFIVQVINFLQNQPAWANTAVVIAYDDSDGWYDHVVPPVVNQSTTASDALTGTGACGDGTTALPGVLPATTHAQGRCGFGPRQPLLVISPWAQPNYVDHTLTNQASIPRFIEDNWLGGTRIGQGSVDAVSNSISNMFNFGGQPNPKKLFLNVATGQPF